MPKINKPRSGHTGPSPVAGWEWLPFADATYLKRVERAVQIIDLRIKGHKPCDSAFKALPGGRSFADIWSDSSIWISYDSGGAAGRFGATLGKEITVSQYSCRMGHWTLVATLIHELAHVNGADGVSHDAEATLQSCMMSAHHNPAIIGQLISTPADPVLVALTKSRMGHAVS
jgi:hypothetical protein